MTERLFNGKPFKRTNRLTRDVPMTPLEKLGEALEKCIIGCQGRRNAERAQAVLDVINEQGWLVLPGWQPIETAPAGKDVLRYEPTTYRRGQVNNHARIVISSGQYPREATHWMLVPEPPKEDK